MFIPNLDVSISIRLCPSNGRPVRVLAKDSDGKVLADSPEALTTNFNCQQVVSEVYQFTYYHSDHSLPVQKTKVFLCANF
jgi:hypothetical protein